MKLVAFLDILGFSDLIKNNSFEELGKIYQVFEKGYKHGVTLNKFALTDDGIIPDFNACQVLAIQISDSIIVWTKEDSARSYFDLIITVRELLGHGIFSGLPMRACIDYGEFGHNLNFHSKEISTNTFFGRAITTAYQQCECQSWSGGFLTKGAVEAYTKVCTTLNDGNIKSSIEIEALEKRHFLKKFRVPFKNKESSEEYCINWVNWQNPKKPHDKLVSAFTKFNKTTSTDRVKEIINNTIEFWNSCPEKV